MMVRIAGHVILEVKTITNLLYSPALKAGLFYLIPLKQKNKV